MTMKEQGKERWDDKLQRRVCRPDVDAYLAALVEIGRRFGFSLAHEDSQGKFVVHSRGDDESFDKFNDNWLQGASIGE